MKPRETMLIAFFAGIAVGMLLFLAFLRNPPKITASFSSAESVMAKSSPLRFLKEYPDLVVRTQGVIHLSSRTVEMQVDLRSPDAGSPNALEAQAVLIGPWERPELHIQSIKKKGVRLHIPL